MNTLELDRQLNEMIIAGKSVDGLKTFYAENVVAQENDEPERRGRDSWIAAREQMEKITNKFKARVLAQAVSGDVSFSEWEYEVDLEGMTCSKGRKVFSMLVALGLILAAWRVSSLSRRSLSAFR